MRTSLFLTFAFLICVTYGSNATVAQIRIEIPNLPRSPKIEKPKREQPKPEPPKVEGSRSTEDRAATTPGPTQLLSASSVAGQDQPTVAKDSIQLTAFTFDVYRKNYDMWSWVPKLEFRVNGPIPSGSQLFVEFQQPGGSAPWLSFDCATEETQKDRWWKTECGGRQVEDKSITTVGTVNFSIKMRNELAGSNATLFSGRMKVAKTLSNEHGPKAVNKFVYYVDHDWNLPIGYVWYTQDSIYGWDYPDFHIGFWVRGDAYNFDPHLFYKGTGSRPAIHGRQAGEQGQL